MTANVLSQSTVRDSIGEYGLWLGMRVILNCLVISSLKEIILLLLIPLESLTYNDQGIFLKVDTFINYMT